MDSTLVSGELLLGKSFYSFLSKVYGWMTLALTITFIFAFATSFIIERNVVLANFIYKANFFLWIILFIMVIGFSAIAHRVNIAITSILFCIYSIFMGVFLGTFISLYTVPSVVVCILATVLLFGVVSLFGYVTKMDMSSWGGLVFTALSGLLIATLLNFALFFIAPGFAEGLYWVLTYVGIAVFVVTLAYDTQMLRKLAYEGERTGMDMNKVALVGALNLYLDFINLFIRILALFGKRR
jgi:FtsH-binding integral membrane protein